MVSSDPARVLGREALERDGMADLTGEMRLPKEQLRSILLISEIL